MSQSTKEKYSILLDRLYDNTMSKRVRWIPDILDSSTVSCSVGSNTVELSEGRSDEQAPIIIVSIRDSSGKLVDLFNDENLNNVRVTGGAFESYWQLLNDLLSVARRQSSGADDILDDIIKNLDDIPF